MPGETIVLYATGLGPTDPPLAAGVAVSAPANLAAPAKVFFGDIQASEVPFAGAIANGVYQINVKVPATVASGDVPLTVEVGGERSQRDLYIATSR